MNDSKYDTILYIDNSKLLEEDYADPRTRPAQGSGALKTGYDIRFGYLKNTQGNNYFNYGNVLRNQISLGAGYGVEVSDFGTEISVKVSYTNPATGKGASKCFLIVFDLTAKGGKGLVKSSAARWRSISDVSQAASYIRSCASSLSGRTSSAD